jgi:hypothetical protein
MANMYHVRSAELYSIHIEETYLFFLAPSPARHILVVRGRLRVVREDWGRVPHSVASHSKSEFIYCMSGNLAGNVV